MAFYLLHNYMDFIGDFNEMFLLYMFKTRYYLFGPFRANNIDKVFFKLKIA